MPPTVARLADDTSGAKRRLCGRSVGVELVEHDARLDARPSLVGIDLEDAVQVLRGVEHDAGADRLSGLRRAAASRRDRHAVLRGDVDGAHHGLRRSRNHDAERFDLVDAGVGRIQRARDLSKRTSPSMARFELALSATSAHSLLALAAGGDRPHRFDAVAAQRVDAVVEIHGGIDVRRNEFNAVADLEIA